jgi:spore coat protein U-like protein
MKTTKLALFAAISGSALAMTTAPASATTASASFQVTATVNASCTIGATDLTFGSYDPTGGNVDASTQVSVACTNSSAWNVGLNEGTFSGATVSNRTMTGPGSFGLHYGLFTDSAHGSVWGNTVGTNTVSGTGTGAAQALTVYGRIPGLQNVGAGNYADTITATVTF